MINTCNPVPVSNSITRNHAGLSRWQLLLALSRTRHGILDMATPCLAALLWLKALPALDLIGWGLFTAFAGYTAVYALNDIVDYQVDREKVQDRKELSPSADLDGIYIRHPMAHGLLPLREGILWAGAWAVLSMIGAYHLNPLCALIFLIAAALETIYCLLLRVSHLRIFVSGIVKTSGGIAAVFAVDPNPDRLFLGILFFWLFFWELGGQNLPNDWTDLEEDRQLQAKTFPVRFGLDVSSRVIILTLTLCVALSGSLLWVMPMQQRILYFPGCLFIGFYFLIVPAIHLNRTRASQQAFELFNRASYYPLAMLILVLFTSVFYS